MKSWEAYIKPKHHFIIKELSLSVFYKQILEVENKFYEFCQDSKANPVIPHQQT